MNDRFKFRVWDKYMQAYVENLAENCVWIEDDGQLGAGIDDDSCILEQCTGLKDKNGNLIYEGDIVIGRKEIVVCELKEYKDVVEYKDGEYFPFNCTGVYNPEKFEIIGNIHEQAEQKD